MSLSYPTPHIVSEPSEIAKTVLMPGDPLRSKFVAENLLEDAVLFNNVRGIQGYTGKYKGVPVSVMASGMGMPSIGIYSYELFSAFGVENIMRIGSAGALQENIRVRDIVLGMGASTNSNYARQYNLPGTLSAIADYELLSEAVTLSKEMGLRYHVGNLLSSDTFYDDDTTCNDRWRKMGIMAIEMEAAALYMNAARLGKRALAICTISDHILTHELTTAEERQTSFTQMMELAFNVAVKMNDK